MKKNSLFVDVVDHSNYVFTDQQFRNEWEASTTGRPLVSGYMGGHKITPFPLFNVLTTEKTGLGFALSDFNSYYEKNLNAVYFLEWNKNNQKFEVYEFKASIGTYFQPFGSDRFKLQPFTALRAGDFFYWMGLKFKKEEGTNDLTYQGYKLLKFLDVPVNLGHHFKNGGFFDFDIIWGGGYSYYEDTKIKKIKKGYSDELQFCKVDFEALKSGTFSVSFDLTDEDKRKLKVQQSKNVGFGQFSENVDSNKLEAGASAFMMGSQHNKKGPRSEDGADYFKAVRVMKNIHPFDFSEKSSNLPTYGIAGNHFDDYTASYPLAGFDGIPLPYVDGYSRLEKFLGKYKNYPIIAPLWGGLHFVGKILKNYESGHWFYSLTYDIVKVGNVGPVNDSILGEFYNVHPYTLQSETKFIYVGMLGNAHRLRVFIKLNNSEKWEEIKNIKEKTDITKVEGYQKGLKNKLLIKIMFSPNQGGENPKIKRLNLAEFVG